MKKPAEQLKRKFSLDPIHDGLVCGLIPEAQFFAAYEQASGFKVVPQTVHWYKVYNNFSIAILTLATGYRIARNGKTHQDVLVAWLIGIGYTILEEVRSLITMES